MKIKFVCFKFSKTVCMLITVVILQLMLLGTMLVNRREEKSFEAIQRQIESENTTKNTAEEQSTNPIIQDTNTIVENTIPENNLPEYVSMPQEVKGYKVIGKIEIPKLKMSNYILEETSTKSLKASITKLYGPDINRVGNFCMAGHNYIKNHMFGGIKKLEEGDCIILTDTFDRSLTYKVYQKYNTDPKDVTCLEQETQGKKEITLISCTAGAIQRIIVKAQESYE